MLRANSLEWPFPPPSSSVVELSMCMRNLLQISLILQETRAMGKWPRGPTFFAGDNTLVEGCPHFAVDASLLEARYPPLLHTESNNLTIFGQQKTRMPLGGGRNKEKGSYCYFQAVHNFQTQDNHACQCFKV